MLSTLAALALLAGAAQASAAGPRITLVEGVFQARPAAAAATLDVFVEGVADAPPRLGQRIRDGELLSLKPRYPLQPGLRYRAVFRDSPSAAPVSQSFAIPKPDLPPTTLQHVYPTAELLPENL